MRLSEELYCEAIKYFAIIRRNEHGYYKIRITPNPKEIDSDYLATI